MNQKLNLIKEEVLTFFKGLLAFKCGRYESAEAKAFCSLCIKLAPEAWYGYYVRAQIAFADKQRGSLTQSLIDANRAIELNPRDFASYLLRARILLRMGSYTECLEDLEIARKLSPKDPNVHLVRGQASLRLGRTVEVVRVIEHLKPTVTGANRAAVWLLEAELARLEQKFQLSRERFETAFSVNPAATATASGLEYCNVLLQLNEGNRAMRFINGVIEANGARAYLFKMRAIVWARAEQYEQALADLAKAEELDPAKLSIHSARGLIFLQLGRCEDALLEVERDKESIDSISVKAQILAEVGQTAEAERLVERLFEGQHLRQSEMFIAAAMTAPKTEGASKAVSLIDEALQTDPLNPRLHQLKAQMSEEPDERSKSDEEYKRLLRTFWDDDEENVQRRSA